MTDEQRKTLEELKYEGLAALIVQTREEDQQRWKDFKDLFAEFKANLKEDMDELKNYNKVQNGRMVTAMEKISELEKKEISRVEDCPLNEKVRKLEDDSLSAKSVKKWVTKTVGITAGTLTGLWIVFQIVVKLIENAPS
jgi:Na+/phosphate symporter